MKTKRAATLLLAASLAVTAMPGAQLTASAEEKTKIVFLAAGTEEERKVYFDSLIKAFEAENPDIEVELQQTAWGDDFETKLNTGFASGTAPDVIYFSLASIGTRVPLGQYYPLTEYTQDWDQLDDFVDSSLQLGQVNGVQYGIPIFADARIFLYNKALFEEAGLDPDSPPTTWEELKAAHEALTIKDDDGNVTQAGFSVPTSGSGQQHLFSVFIEQNGVKNLVDEDTNEILFNTPEAVEAAEFLNELREIGNIPWDSTSLENDPFVNGDAAMTITSTDVYKLLKQSDIGDDIAIANPLSNKETATFCGTHFLFISSESEYKDAAWKFIEFAESAENMWDRYEQLGFVPLRESLRDQYIAQDPDTHEAIFNSITNGHGSPKVPYFNNLINAVNASMEEIAYGVSAPQESLDAAAQLVQDEINNA